MHNVTRKIMAKKKTAKTKRPKVKRYYGVTKVSEGAKNCWVSAENKFGWSLGFDLGGRVVWLRNVRFTSSKEVKRALKSSIVFVEKKGK